MPKKILLKYLNISISSVGNMICSWSHNLNNIETLQINLMSRLSKYIEFMPEKIFIDILWQLIFWEFSVMKNYKFVNKYSLFFPTKM